MARRVAAVDEVPFWIEVNGRRVRSWTCTPELPEALAAGRLLCDGYITRCADLLSLEVVRAPDGALGVRAQIPPERLALPEDRPAGDDHASTTGTAHPRGDTAPTAPTAPPPLERFPDLFRELYGSAERSRETGGMHAAALCDGERLLFACEEVGRHNAADKAIGAALLAEADLSRLGLVISARVSGEIARKAARAGLAWVASRSVPTTLAVARARSARFPIVARAAGHDAYVFESMNGEAGKPDADERPGNDERPAGPAEGTG